MKRIHSIYLAAALVAAFSTLQALVVAAQEPATDSQPSARPVVDETKLDQFAAAYIRIHALQKQASQQPASGDPVAAQQKQTDLENKMTEAVRQSGLDVVEFNTIAQAMVSDTDLRTRIQIKVQELSRKGS